MKTPFIIGFVAGFLACIPRLLHYYTDVFGTLPFNRIDLIELTIVFIAVPIGVFIGKTQQAGGAYMFQDAFKSGIKVVGIAALMVSAFTYIYFRFIDHEILNQTIIENVEYLKEQGATQEEIKQTEQGIEQFFSPFIQATSTLMFTLVGGAFFSLISSVVFGKFPR